MKNHSFHILLFLIVSLQASAQSLLVNDDLEIINAKEINTDDSEFSPSVWNDYILFVKTSDSVSRITHDRHFDLYYTLPRSDSSDSFIKNLSPEINSELHEGPCSFDYRDQILYFSSVNMADSLLDAHSLPPNNLYYSEYRDGMWAEPTHSRLNSLGSQSCHPAVSFHSNFIVFSSDRESRDGDMDLFISRRTDGTWDSPTAFGKEINSPLHELFPFIDKKNNLYFARKNEETGLDIYKAQYAPELNSYLPAIKLPPPVNTRFDDFGIYINEDMRSGYFSSNRPGGKGADDIYYLGSNTELFDFTRAETLTQSIEIEVVDENGRKLQDVLIKLGRLVEDNISLIDPSIEDPGSIVIFDSLYTDKYGYAKTEIMPEPLVLTAELPGKETWKRLILSELENRMFTVILSDEEMAPQTGVDKESSIDDLRKQNLEVGHVITFNNIYYEYNSAEIQPGAAYELDVLADAMIHNPDLVVELRAHTDVRGDASYNQKLSERRAEAAKNYLISKGVLPENIRTIGLGESRVRNRCKEGIPCTEAEHIYNRRTEVVILAK